MRETTILLIQAPIEFQSICPAGFRFGDGSRKSGEDEACGAAQRGRFTGDPRAATRNPPFIVAGAG